MSAQFHQFEKKPEASGHSVQLFRVGAPGRRSRLVALGCLTLAAAVLGVAAPLGTVSPWVLAASVPEGLVR